MSRGEAARLISEEVERHGVQVASDGLGALEQYVGLLQTWSRRHRIVGDPSLGTVIQVHLSDSLAWLRAVREVNGGAGGGVGVIDVGTGAGLPGLVAALAWNRLEVLLCEVARKRTSFLYWVLQQMGVGASVFEGSVDEVVQRGLRFTNAVSRAFRSPAEWMELAPRLVTPGGWVWFLLNSEQQVPGGRGDHDYVYRLADGRRRRVVGVRHRAVSGSRG